MKKTINITVTLLTIAFLMPLSVSGQQTNEWQQTSFQGTCEYLQIGSSQMSCGTSLFRVIYPESRPNKLGIWFSVEIEDQFAILSFSGSVLKESVNSNGQVEMHVFDVSSTENSVMVEGVCIYPQELKPSSEFVCEAIDYNGEIIRAKFIASEMTED